MVSSLVTLGTLFWRGGRIEEKVETTNKRVTGLHEKVDGINGSVRASERSISGCQAHQINCPHANPQIRHP